MDPTSATKVAEEAAKALGIVQLVPKIYEDVLQPAARQMGQNLVPVAKAVNIALMPLRLTVWGYEKIEDFLKAKVTARLAGKPAEEIKQPSTVIAGPVMMGMAFAAEAPHLREMYANLLAEAMHAPSAEKAHPAFVQIIQQISPAEARILKEATRKKNFGLSVQNHFTEGGSRKPNLHYLIEEKWKAFCQGCGITNPTLLRAYLDNLTRLGIFTEKENIVQDAWGGPSSFKGVALLGLTSYGSLFLDVCVREPVSQPAKQNKKSNAL
jgi:hypothetical protein